MIKKLTVIGLGLIGGSFAKALRQTGLVESVVGFDVDRQSLDAGCELGVIDVAASSLSDAVTGADVIVLAVPVKAVSAVLHQLKPFIHPEALLTDVGSVKGSFIDAVREVFGSVSPFVIPGHPIAGSERSGVYAADHTLFDRHKVIITPFEHTDDVARRRLTALWRACGAEVIEMSVSHHDEVLAATSHLPHLIAFSLVDTLAGEEDNREIFKYAAGGFRDFTRIAASDPVMWRDIFIANNESILRVLEHFSSDLERLKQAIRLGDGDYLLETFSRAKAAREHFGRLLSEQASNKTMNSKDIIFKALPGGTVNGEIRMPGDKSISHRSIMFGSLAEGVTEVSGFLEGEDSLATLQAFRDMGVQIEGPDQGRVTIHGVGMNGLKAPSKPLDLGNSGTAMRLFAGILAGQSFDTELVGDASLTKRPMGRVADPLRTMGAVIETAEGGRPPLKIKGGQTLKGIHYDMPMASAQVKSCLLLAGLYADGDTSVTEPAPTRDHTERMLRGFGVDVESKGDTACIKSGSVLKAAPIDVPADISSAAFFMVAASITPGADLVLRHVGMNPTRVGVINILRLMGANIEVSNEREIGGEPVADIRVQYAELNGIQIPEDQVPLAIDEFPVLFIAAVCAKGRTVLTGAEELRVKESDRIQVMADGLAAVGVQTEVTPDGIVIDGAPMQGGEVNSHGDHRIAMAFSVAALRAEGPIVIHDCANVATSFPNFIELARQVGMQLTVSGAE